MKIGILTYFAAHNYGAFLQAYALQKTLQSFAECEAELINYRSPNEIDFYNHVGVLPPITITNFPKNIFKKISEKKYYKKRHSCFEQAIKDYQIVSKKCLVTLSLEEFNDTFEKEYDLIVVGSDEIWKLDSFRGFPNVYWLPNTKCKKVSYAASSRNNYSQIDKKMINKIASYLESFDYIGVRDKATELFVNCLNAVKEKCCINCDPTFLYDFHFNPENGRKILKNRFKVKGKKKVIGLMMGEVEIARDVISTYGHLFDFISLYHYCPNTKNCPSVTPFEWIDIISALDGIITTFFHATVFSLKCNTKFFSIDTRSENISESKIHDLLSRNNVLDGRFTLYSKDKHYGILLNNIGSFLSDVLRDSDVSFSRVCNNERQLSNSFFNFLRFSNRGTVADIDSKDCCGCGLCSNVCPTNAISMELSNEGFYKPVVNKGKCINCGLCASKCANNDTWGGNRTWDNLPKAYGLKHKDETIRKESRSGGAFTMLSDYILDNNGVVYGSALCDGNNVRHIRATTKSERDKMRGSKYVQSPSFDLFKSIKSDLTSNKIVIYSGTPCQVAAVRKYCEDVDCSKLILVDILCHGVPSISVWKDYVAFCEREYHGAVQKFDFRNKKDFGWWEHVESFWVNNERYDCRYFSQLYYKHVIFDRSCSYCKFKSTERVSDFTLGDFWGVDKAIPGFDDNRGVSLLLVSSKRGQEIFEAVKEQAEYREVPIEKCKQNSMVKPYAEPLDRNDFWNKYKKSGIAGVLRMYKRKQEIAKIIGFPRKIIVKTKKIIKNVRLH